MKSTIYEKSTGRILYEVSSNKITAALQETDTVGVLVGTPCPAHPDQWIVVDGQLQSIN